MGVEVRRCTVAELRDAPNIDDVIGQYADESSMPEYGPANVQWEAFVNLETQGLLHPIGAFVGGLPMGFVGVMVIPTLHYGVWIAAVSEIFVTVEARKGGVGLMLIHGIEAIAKECGAKAVQFSAPVDGQLAGVLPRLGYRNCNLIFVKAMT